LKAFTHSTLSWQSHASEVEEIKRHVNNAGQQQAIARIGPQLKELASNVTPTIEHLNQKPKLLQTGPYVDYAAANYDLASDLAELISDMWNKGNRRLRQKS